MNLSLNSFKLIRNSFALAVLLVYCAIVPMVEAAQQSAAATNVITGHITLIDKNGNELADRSDVVIFVDGVDTSVRHPNANSAPIISQKDHTFAPSVLPVERGTTVRFPNDDTMFHNVFSLSRSKNFDLGIYPVGESRQVNFDKPGLVTVYCNIHPHMVSRILVLNNPFYATTSSDGSYSIAGIPDGEFLLRTWSSRGEENRVTVTVRGGVTQQHNFTIATIITSSKHKNKFGMPYQEKY